ncbi:MAG: CocE/NonD family hydrolase C-terminal non-catalytic domain-containing protein, partial [Leptolyngbya sp.]|nr:CocE/NonD family hydrolase C-terminal non-catalytic domain-containing protein [Leptolyngbya sp.]
LPSPQAVTLPLQATSFTLPPGHALRLSLAAAAFPAYPVNSGTVATVDNVPKMQHRVITLAVWHGPETASCLDLPISKDSGLVQCQA